MAILVVPLNVRPIWTRFRIPLATVRAVHIMREPTGINLPQVRVEVLQVNRLRSRGPGTGADQQLRLQPESEVLGPEIAGPSAD
jgi:hypothetical protein